MRGPLQNRVEPGGKIVATRSRYGEPTGRMGNRGVLHSARNRQILRPFRSKAWLICCLQFKGRHREVMAPNRYTELFFLDDFVALSAGHRPCAHCRRPEFKSFAENWARCHHHHHHRHHHRWTAREIDELLHEQRLAGPRPLTSPLPDGAMIRCCEDSYLLWQGKYHRFAHEGYDRRVDVDDLDPANCEVLTPPSTLKVLQAGWRPDLPAPHSTASSCCC
ncbi:hypothetical protein CTAYLR_007655 [Chrysophaeum taylorii]|uniref:Uncharacterized protein n=1 Tax=Chrysophaeum taylorii TaxID=2483200 RepID=A0AAD7U6Z2_9STRA|nr:hypothetical protein CTAYLR_007655 [Chrysophaeum taylorii]